MSAAVQAYHAAVTQFKKDFLARMLAEHGGNRTHTARAIGLQRTYLLRLLREFGLNQPSLTASRAQNGNRTNTDESRRTERRTPVRGPNPVTGRAPLNASSVPTTARISYF